MLPTKILSQITAPFIINVQLGLRIQTGRFLPRTFDIGWQCFLRIQ
jgi:hypothetical protein